MTVDLKMERKLQEKLEYFCKYKCDQGEIEDTIIDMLSGDIEDVGIEGSMCDICKLKDFINEVKDELR